MGCCSGDPSHVVEGVEGLTFLDGRFGRQEQ